MPLTPPSPEATTETEPTIPTDPQDGVRVTPQKRLETIEEAVIKEFDIRALPELLKNNQSLLTYFENGEKIMGGENFVMSVIAGLEVRDHRFIRAGLKFCEGCFKKETLTAKETVENEGSRELAELSSFYGQLAEAPDEEIETWADKVRAAYQEAIAAARADLDNVDKWLNEVTPEVDRKALNHPQNTIHYTNRPLGVFVSDRLKSSTGIDISHHVWQSSGFLSLPDINGDRYRIVFIDMTHQKTDDGYEPAVNLDRLRSSQAHEAFHGSTKAKVYKPSPEEPALKSTVVVEGFHYLYDINGQLYDILAMNKTLPSIAIEEGMALEFQRRYSQDEDISIRLPNRYRHCQNLNQLLIDKVGSYESLMSLRLRGSNNTLARYFVTLPSSTQTEYWKLEDEFRKSLHF